MFLLVLFRPIVGNLTRRFDLITNIDKYKRFVMFFFCTGRLAYTYSLTSDGMVIDILSPFLITFFNVIVILGT